MVGALFDTELHKMTIMSIDRLCGYLARVIFVHIGTGPPPRSGMPGPSGSCRHSATPCIHPWGFSDSHILFCARMCDRLVQQRHG